MYGKYAEGLSAEAMALEVIGVIKGHAKLPGYDKLGPQQQASAADYAKKIGGTLERDGRSMRPDFREFLTEAQQHFTALGQLSSFVDTKVTDIRTRRRRLEANPAFEARYEELQQSLDEKGTALFREHFLPEVAEKSRFMSDIRKQAYVRGQGELAFKIAYNGKMI